MFPSFKKKIQDIDLSSLLRNKVLINIFTVGIITLFIKLIGFYKESVVAANFGLSEILDTFLIASLVPGFIDTVFLGAFKNVFIPSYVSELKSDKNIGSFQTTGFIVTAGVSFLFVIIAFLFTDIYLNSFFPGHSEEYYVLIKKQFYILSPCIVIWGFSSMLGGLLNVSGEFRFSSFGNIFVPLAIILSLLFLKERLNSLVLAIGTLIGSIVCFLYYITLCLKNKILHISKPDFKSRNAKIMFKQLPAKVSSGFLTGMNGVVDQFFAAQLALGSIAALNYGKKMPSFLSGLLVIAITNVLLPHFSNLVIRDKKKSFKKLFKMFKIVFFGTIVFSALGILFTDFFVELFFERKEFDSDDTILVGSIQKIFLFYLPFSITGMINVNFLTSINKNNFMAYVSLIALVLNIALDYLLIQFYGIFGIAICTAVVVIIKNSIMFLYTYRESKKLALE